MGEGMVFVGQLDANVVALDIRTGREVWKTPIEKWRNGYSITCAASTTMHCIQRHLRG